jgi:predicted ATPase/DNA-binding CsgD family transcriptional regulator
VARQKRRLGNLPAETTSFVGRRRELAELRSALAKARLVSLVGPGGVGKTRLALRAATDLGRGFADGAWWLDLAEIREAALVAGAAVAALDLRDQAAAEPVQILSSYLRDREVLLLVDNCEHVLDASAALMADLLRAAPYVRVIATSREPLQVAGEHVVPVPPLELPPPGDERSVARLLQNEAVMLFAERAAAASGSFDLSASNRSAVVGLCRRLDGLPLAIELAAVRTRVLSVEQILDRLTDRFALLTGGGRAALPRQQTLRTTIDWSHDLLSAEEQRLLRRLCVFAGPFTVDDVEPVVAIDRESGALALDLLAALVDKSLVTREDAFGVACYRLHETMREYAALKLREAGEVELLDDVYVEHYRTRSRDLRAALLRDLRAAVHALEPGRDRTAEWLQWVDLEIDNIRGALQTCLATSDWQRGLELATSVGYYWVTRGTTESIRWFDDLLAAAEGSADIPARAYYFRGWLSMLKGDPDAAVPWLARAIAAARATGQLPQLSESLSLASTAAIVTGDHAEARRLLDEAATITPGLEHYPASMGLIQARAIHALFEGDLAAAEAASSEGARMSREVGDLYYLERMLMNLGLVAVAGGDLTASKARFIEGLRVAKRSDNRLGQSTFLRQLGVQAAMSGQPHLGARLLGAADALAAAAGANAASPVEPGLRRAREAAVAGMGAARFEAEYTAGTHLTREAALRLALDEPDDVGVDADEPVETGPLSKREAEVARLIAEGLANKEIGARLFISERTVTTHVGNILNKLGFDSRVQVASWIATSSAAARPEG